jgi:hypothetical protein
VGTAKSVAFVVRHPIRTLQGLGRALLHPIETGQAIGQMISEKSGTLRGQGELVGDVLIGVATGGAVKAASKTATLAKITSKLRQVGVHAPKGLPGTTAETVSDKLQRYLLNAEHPVGGPKAKWFEEALGYTQENAAALARQIVFDPAKAVATELTQHGQKFEQVISIVGANGKAIDVNFVWIRNNDGVVRLVTAIPTKR